MSDSFVSLRHLAVEEVLVMGAASLCPETSEKLDDAIKELCERQHLDHAAIVFAAGRRIEERISRRNTETSKRIDELQRTFKHTHVAGGVYPDWCAVCGLNFRDPIHCWIGELPGPAKFEKDIARLQNAEGK